MLPILICLISIQGLSPTFFSFPHCTPILQDLCLCLPESLTVSLHSENVLFVMEFLEPRSNCFLHWNLQTNSSLIMTAVKLFLRTFWKLGFSSSIQISFSINSVMELRNLYFWHALQVIMIGAYFENHCWWCNSEKKMQWTVVFSRSSNWIL